MTYVSTGYSGAIFTSVSTNIYGDLRVKGHSALGSYTLEYFCLIKVMPVSDNKHFLNISSGGTFLYGISAGFLSSASWEFSYVVVSEDTGAVIGESWYKESDSVSFSYKDNQEWSPDGQEWVLYEREGFVTSTGYYFENTQWYYVGIKITLYLANYADIYKTTTQLGKAHWNPSYIHFDFTSFYDPSPP